MTRAVLDANVLVSALISSRGSPGEILAQWEQERFELVVSPAILEELQRVIRYPRFQERYHLPKDAVARFLDLISSQAILVYPERTVNIVHDDPTDNRYLECALAGEVNYLITGDRHLLELEAYEGILILPPAGFLVILELGM